MVSRIITISRQFGSGGHEIGVKLAKRLGVKFYDKELVDLLAKDGKYDVNFIEAHEEKCSPPICPVMPGFAMPVFYQDLPSDLIYKGQSKLIRTLAERGPCVVVGRCADYILKDRGDCLHVFVHAPLKDRAERIVRLYGETSEKPEKRLMDKDKKRSVNYRYYTDREWGLSQNYHLCLDSSEFGIEGCVDIIVELSK